VPPGNALFDRHRDEFFCPVIQGLLSAMSEISMALIIKLEARVGG